MHGKFVFSRKQTAARTAFKHVLGQANHFLITILVGLDGVRSGAATASPQLHAVWNPHDLVSSADRSRAFALDMSLVRAVDALDAYMMQSRRKPAAVPPGEFRNEIDAAGRSVAKRLGAYQRHTSLLTPDRLAFMRLAIDWRNQRVHSLADEAFQSEDERILRAASASIKTDFRGLVVDEMLSQFRARKAPRLKEAAGIIALVQDAVEIFDEHLKGTLDLPTYIRSSLSQNLGHSPTHTFEVQLRKAAGNIWGDPVTRTTRVKRALQMSGVTEAGTASNGRAVPPEFIDDLMTMTPESALLFLLDNENPDI